MANYGYGGIPRDMQKNRLYRAESVLSKYDEIVTVTEVEAFFKKVLTSTYVTRKYGTHARVYLRMDGRSRSWAWARLDGQVDLSAAFARRKHIVLHELAHHFAGLSAQHGWKFCMVYLDLVRHFMGRDAAEAFKASMKARKVKFTAPRAKTPRTAAQIAAAEAGRDRLAEARERRNGASGTFGILLEDQYNRVLVRNLNRYGRVTKGTHYSANAKVWKTQTGVTAAFAKMQHYVGDRTTALIVDLSKIRTDAVSLKYLVPETVVVKF